MLLIPPTEFRKRRGRSRPAPPPRALTFVAAVYVDSDSITLTFDRAIDIAALDGTRIVVDDETVSAAAYDATGPATLVTPQTVRIVLVMIGPHSGSGIHLDAAAGNGIAAVDDGGTWPGVTGLELPFP